MAKDQINQFMIRVLTPLIYILIRLYLSFVRVRVVNEEVLTNHLQNGGKAVCCFWHQRFLGALRYAKRLGTFSPSIMISQSQDGEWIAQVAMRYGFRPIRGSSTRGGKEALAAIVQDLAQHTFVVHAVDGPQGPRGVVKAGLIRMAQLSCAAIFPLHISINRAWIANSWDRTLIPKPFSRILIRWGNPILVPEQMDSQTFEVMRVEVEQNLMQGHAQDDLEWGREKPL